MQSQTAKETEIVFIRLASITVSMILTYVCGKKCLVANWMIPDLPHKPSNNFKRDPSPILNLVSVVELTLRNRYKGSKSLWLEIRNGCSKTKLLLAEGWWCCKSPVSVFHGIKPKEKLTLNTVGWSANIRLSCSRRLAGCDGWEAKIIPILQSVLATETGGDLWPVLPLRLSNIFVRAWDKVGRNVNRIRFPTGTCSCSGCLRGSWSSTRISRLPGSFRSQSVIRGRSAAFTVFCLLLLMRGADMSLKTGAGLKGFSTRITSERALCDTFLVCLKMIDSRFVWKLLITAVALVRFLPSRGSYMSF